MTLGEANQSTGDADDASAAWCVPSGEKSAYWDIVAGDFTANSAAVASSGAYWVTGSEVWLRDPAGAFSMLAQAISAGPISGVVAGDSVFLISGGQPNAIVRVGGGGADRAPRRQM